MTLGDLDLFYAEVKFGHLRFCMRKCENYLFLAHLSHRLRVSYCHRPMSVVCCPSCVVHCQQYALNDNSSETTRPRALIFGM